MLANQKELSPLFVARSAGGFYLLIIVLGLAGELLIRSGLIVAGDAAATAANILGSERLFRIGFVTDSLMVLSDVALAVLLYVLLRPVSRVIALMAMCFRLAQSVVLAVNLVHYHAAVLLLTEAGNASAFGKASLDAMSAFFLDLYSHGYDLGLILFAVNCALLGWLVYRSRYLPRFLGILLAAAAFVYFAGSYVRFLAPGFTDDFAPAYLVPIIAELSLCIWLLVKGVRVAEWEQAVISSKGLD